MCLLPLFVRKLLPYNLLLPTLAMLVCLKVVGSNKINAPDHLDSCSDVFACMLN